MYTTKLSKLSFENEMSQYNAGRKYKQNLEKCKSSNNLEREKERIQKEFRNNK